MGVAITIKRYDPPKSDAPYKEEHLLSIDDRSHITILDILYMIKNRKDGSLAFRSSCKSGICGSCAIRVNGHEALACTTDLMEVVKRYGKVVIEPLKNLDVIKDLVVDLKPMWNRLLRSDPWLISDHNPPQSPLNLRGDKGELEVKGGMGGFSGEKTALLNIVSSCILCGACYSDCEAFKVDPGFLGPAVFNKGYRFIMDPRDMGKKDRLKKLTESGLWHCSHCYLCSSICPKGINPKDSVSYLRTQAYRIGIKDNLGTRYIEGFYNNVKRSGRISEALLALKVKGINIIKDIPFFSKVLIHGKVPGLKRPIKGINEVKKIYEIIENEGSGRG